MVGETRLVKLYDEAGNAVGSWFPYSGVALLGGKYYARKYVIEVEFCEQVDGDHCKCSNCMTVIDFKKDSFCRGCGAEIYA